MMFQNDHAQFKIYADFYIVSDHFGTLCIKEYYKKTYFYVG